MTCLKKFTVMVYFIDSENTCVLGLCVCVCVISTPGALQMCK